MTMIYQTRYIALTQTEWDTTKGYVHRFRVLREKAKTEGFVDSSEEAAERLRNGVNKEWYPLACTIYDHLWSADSRDGARIDLDQFMEDLIKEIDSAIESHSLSKWKSAEAHRLDALAEQGEEEVRNCRMTLKLLKLEKASIDKKIEAQQYQIAQAIDKIDANRDAARASRRAALIHWEECGLSGGPAESDPTELYMSLVYDDGSDVERRSHLGTFAFMEGSPGPEGLGEWTPADYDFDAPLFTAEAGPSHPPGF